MDKPVIFVEFQNTDRDDRVRLNAAGTLEDLSRQEIELKNGLVMTLYSDDGYYDGQPDELMVEGVAFYSEKVRCWVASIDWKAIRHACEAIKP